MRFSVTESTITSKGRTTLPKRVREALRARPGDRVRYVLLGREVHILPLRPIRRLFGVLEHDGAPVTLEDRERVVVEGACESW